MARFVLDLSVLIDLNNVDLLGRFLDLPVDVLISDAGLAKCEEEKGLDINRFLARLIPCAYDATEMTRVALLMRQHPKLKFDDLVAFLLAKRECAILLTGDGPLRQLARDSSVEFHGTPWVLDYLVSAGVISRKQASIALENIVAEGSRLPANIVARYLRQWSDDA